MQNPLVRAWGYLVEPRLITFLMFLVYVMMVLGGSFILFEPSIAATVWLWSRTFDYIWATMVILAGLMGMFATPKGLWFVERPAIILAVTGLFCYATSLVMVDKYHVEGNQPWQATVSGIVILFMMTRWSRIRWAEMDPTK